MNAEILRNMSIIAEDERLMARAAKYLRKLVSEKEDATLFTKEESASAAAQLSIAGYKWRALHRGNWMEKGCNNNS